MSEFTLAQQLEGEGREMEAVDAYFRAVHADPTNGEYCAAFAKAIRFLSFNSTNPHLHNALLRCFDCPQVNAQHLATPTASILALNLTYDALVKDPLFIYLLTNCIIPHAKLEQMIGTIRHAMLSAAVQGKLTDQLLPLCIALAHYSFLNEYVLVESKEESALIDSLNSKTPPSAPIIAILASYRPLNSYPFASALSTTHDPRLNSLINKQLTAPQREQALILTIPKLKAVENAVSQLVRSQYEENPYPRWNFLPKTTAQDTGLVLQRLFPWITRPQLSDPEILIAGCGTGQQAIQAALTYKDARILALDLSATSLAYAMRKAQEMKITNISFLQGDILDLENDVKRFDIIEVVGVLHHMEDPFRAWGILRKLLKQDGWMNIGLYSAIGRADLKATQEYIAQHRFSPTLEGIRLCRRELMRLPEDNPLKAITQSVDFYTTSACRDLLFHAHEMAFSLPQIADYLKKLDLTFVGFDLPIPSISKRYHEEYPHDPSGGTLEHWDEFERKHPETFVGMYQFWVVPSAS